MRCAPTDSSAIDELRQIVAVLIVFLLGIATMMVGSVSFDPRLRIAGIPLSPLLFAAAGTFALVVPQIRFVAAWIALLITPIGLLSVTLLWSPNGDYGVFKVFNIVACAILSMPLIAVIGRHFGIRTTASLWVAVMFFLLCLTLLYKLRFGFFDRQVLFLLNGPIVFARLMGIAAVLSLFVFAGNARILAVSAFTLAVLWTMSKGPLLALIATVLVTTMFLLKGRDRLNLIIGSGAIIVLGILMYWDVLNSVDWGRLDALARIVAGDFSSRPQDFESTSIRVLMYQETWDLIERRPLGVGIGGWETAVAENFGLHYPHNLFLELWSEGGLVLGTIASIPFLYFLLPGPAPIRAVAFFLFLAQMVSGDLLDARYLLLWSLLVPLSKVPVHKCGVRQYRSDAAEIRVRPT